MPLEPREGPPRPNPFIDSPFEFGVPAKFKPGIGAPLLLEFELIPVGPAVGSEPMLGLDDRPWAFGWALLLSMCVKISLVYFNLLVISALLLSRA